MIIRFKEFIIGFAKNWPLILSAEFEILGLVWLELEFLKSMVGPEKDQILESSLLCIILIPLIIGLKRGFPKNKVSRKIQGTDTTISVIRGNIFSSKNVLVVAAPTTFDTRTEDDTIDRKSVQGQYQRKFFPNEALIIEQIDNQLAALTVETTFTRERKSTGPLEKYLAGEVLFIQNNKRNAIYVSMATFNENMRATMASSEYVDALPKLWEGARIKGDNGHLDIPLIGSGFSRLDAVRKEILAEIVASFVAATRDSKITDCLSIYITPTDFRVGDFSFDDIERMLDKECGQIFSGIRLPQSAQNEI